MLAILRHLAIPNDQTGNENIQKVEPGEFIRLILKEKLKKNFIGIL